eukprot:13953715-Alexandrium_andersonii.AAC.1
MRSSVCALRASPEVLVLMWLASASRRCPPSHKDPHSVLTVVLPTPLVLRWPLCDALQQVLDAVGD